MRVDCIERRFAAVFGRYAAIVVHHPSPFIIVPVLVTLALSAGLLRHSTAFMKDELELYTPTDAQARRELVALDALFHINDSDPFYATRRYDIKRAGYIIVTGREEESDILNPLVMQAAMQLWSIVQSLTIEDQMERRINYPSICVKFPMPQEFGRALAAFLSPNMSSPEDICVSNPLVEAFKFALISDGSSILNRSIDEITLNQISEAISFDSLGMTHLLGGVSVDSAKRISGAKAIMLPYALRHSNDVEDRLAEKWELKLADFLLAYQSPAIHTAWWTYETLASESARDRYQLTRMLVPCFLAVSMYTVLCCCVWSMVRSRPWLALAGVASAAMAIISAVGALLLVGFGMTSVAYSMPFIVFSVGALLLVGFGMISVAYSMPFIVFSVGVDNVFILLSAWRTTEPQYTLSERMSETFSEAAVSITVTSLTDLISFGVGCLTPFPSVKMFCAYAVVAVAFVYVYQLTFFAGMMVLTGQREISGRSCLTFRTIEAPAGGFSIEVPARYWSVEKKRRREKKRVNNNKNKNKLTSFEQNHCLARFFHDQYSDLLLNPFVRLAILTCFILYLGVATWGCANIKLGLEPNDLLPDNSYGKRTLAMQEKYFSDYGSYLHVWMYNLSTVDLGHKRIWLVLEREIELYEHTEFTGKSDSWLRTFVAFVKQAGLLITPDNFAYILKNVFLSQPQYAKYNRDIVFDEKKSGELDASRIPVHLRFVGASNQSRAMNLFRRLAETSEVPTGVYADFFQFAEQYDSVLPGTLSSIAMAGAAVVLVSLLLIPEPSASLWVAFSIVSINVGILGFMTFWSVRLDFISMVTIVMSIGFCIDFAAHLACLFSRGRDVHSSQRMRKALYAVGTPILQSASSTIIGVSFMASAESYVFRSFLKTIILVIVLGAIHGLIILPVLLTLFHCGDEQQDEQQKKGDRPVTLNSKSSTFTLQHHYEPHPVYPRSETDSDIYRVSSKSLDLPLSQVSTTEMDNKSLEDPHFSGLRPRLPADWVAAHHEQFAFRHSAMHR